MEKSIKQQLINATFMNDYDLVVKLLDSQQYDESVINNIGIFSIPFPLFYVTMCYKRTMWTDFNNDVMPFIIEQRKNIDLLLNMWRDRFGANVDAAIDYKKYGEFFFCDDDSYTLEDIFCGITIDKYLENGCRQIDLELYASVSKFNFANVRELLELGANPDADLIPVDRDDICNCLDRIETECSYLCTCQIFPLIMTETEKVLDNHTNVKFQDICDLIGWAAHEDMCALLKEYIHNG